MLPPSLQSISHKNNQTLIYKAQVADRTWTSVHTLFICCISQGLREKLGTFQTV